MNSRCINYNPDIRNKVKNKLRMKAKNYAYFKLEEKATKSVKKNKNNFSHEFAMSTR